MFKQHSLPEDDTELEKTVQVHEFPFQISQSPYGVGNKKSWVYPDDPALLNDMCRWISGDGIILDVLHKVLESQRDIRMIPYLRDGIPGFAFLGQDVITSQMWDRIRFETLNRAKEEGKSIQSMSDDQFAKVVWLEGIMRFEEEYFVEKRSARRNSYRRSPSPSSLGDELVERVTTSSELDLPVQRRIRTRRYTRDHSTDMKPQVTIDMTQSPHERGVDEAISRMKQNSDLERLASRSWAGGMICPHESCKSWNPNVWPRKGINVCCACHRDVDQWVDTTSLRKREQELLVAEGLTRGAEEALGGVGIFGGGFAAGIVSALLVLKIVVSVKMSR